MQNADGENLGEAFEKALEGLREQMLSELARLDTDMRPEVSTSEQRLKFISAYLKTLQEIEGMVRQIREKSDNGSANGIDVVEFRRQLEMQIERLIDSEVASTIPTGTE